MKMFKKLVLPALLGLSFIGNAHAFGYKNSKEIVNDGYEIHARCDLSVTKSRFESTNVGDKYIFYYVYHLDEFYRMEFSKDGFLELFKFKQEIKGGYIEPTVIISKDLNEAVYISAQAWFEPGQDWAYKFAKGPCTWFK